MAGTDQYFQKIVRFLFTGKMCEPVPNLFKSCSISSHNTTAINYCAIVSAGPIANCVGKVLNNFKPDSKKFPITYWMV